MATPPTNTEETTGRAVASLIFSLMGVALWCPCIGSLIGILLATGEKSGVGRAGLILGWIGMGVCLLVGLSVGLQVLVVGILDGL